jgi:ribonuclease HII
LNIHNIIFKDNIINMPKKEAVPLERFYDDANKYEICLDEAGRGCLFGRVYIACVVLPKEPTMFDGTDIKDSKKFSSKKKLNEVAEYIKQNSLYWSIEYVDEKEIDKINILKSAMKGMHNCIKNSLSHLSIRENARTDDFTAVVDGNYFTPYMLFDEDKQALVQLKSTTIEKGDAKYMGIAAASILAKSARDGYVEELCDKYPILDEYYGLKKNVGYATKLHREGIIDHGITQWHRKTFGQLCREAPLHMVVE